ncbi:retrovirus-related pol polyprotein from transposon TNT 1-94 [Tanacetum coccineum]
MKVKESLIVTFDESPPPTKLSPLVDDDVGEEEAIKNNTKVNPKISEALKDESWVIAMQEELNQFVANDVWDLVPLPLSQSFIGTKWVFRNKLDENGIVSRNKARLVAQGYNQQEGIDYDETYAPVARSSNQANGRRNIFQSINGTSRRMLKSSGRKDSKYQPRRDGNGDQAHYGGWKQTLWIALKYKETDIQEKIKKKAKSKQIRARNGKDKVKSQAK